MQNRCSARLIFPTGAENGTRTRDPDLGKVVLYQLSYFRLFLLVVKTTRFGESFFKTGCKGTAFF